MPRRKAFLSDGKSISFEDTFEKRQELIKKWAICFDAFSHHDIDDKIVIGDLIININYSSLVKNLSCAENIITMMSIHYGLSPSSLLIQIRNNFISIIIKKEVLGSTKGDYKLIDIYKNIIDIFIDKNQEKRYISPSVNPVNISLSSSIYVKDVILLSYENFMNYIETQQIPESDRDFEYTPAFDINWHEMFIFHQLNCHTKKIYSVLKEDINFCSQKCCFLKNLKENSSLDNIQIKMLTGVFAHLGASGLNIISKIFSNAPTETIEKIKFAFYESVQNRTIMPCRTLIEQKQCKEPCGCTTPLMICLQYKQENITETKNFIINDRGVFFKQSFEKRMTPPLWICSRIDIIAVTRDINNNSWGKLIRFKDRDGIEHSEIVDIADIVANPDAVRHRLVNSGVTISLEKNARDKLAQYLNEVDPPKKVRVTSKIGWQGTAFVLPDETLGKSDEVFLFKSDNYTSKFNVKGSLEDWKLHIAKRILGNSVPEFCIACAFAAPLLTPCGLDGGGFHLLGDSSSGKTTSLCLAASVCGGGDHGYIQSWRSTDNAIEGIALNHNDCLLCLDEINMATSKTVSESAYMIANGQGKARADRYGNTKSRKEWKLFLLSNGEASIANKIKEEGRKMMAGQAVRIIDIDSDMECGLGVFNKTPDGLKSNEFSDELQAVVSQYYGVALREFISLFAKNIDEYVREIHKNIAEFCKKHCEQDASGQVKRVCARFGLVAAAGELAIKFKILPWPEHTAWDAAAILFKKWTQQRGGTDTLELQTALKTLTEFIQRYGSSRFKILGGNYIQETMSNPAGYKWEFDDHWVYMIERNVFDNEICHSVNPNILKSKIKRNNWWLLNAQGKFMETKSIPGRGNIRGIFVDPQKWEDTDLNSTL